MTTYTWPAALRPASFEAQLVPNVRGFSSSYGGASQALDLIGERWRFALTLPPCLPADAGAREALFAKLRGGANRVSLHHFGRPRPMGTLRGSPTLGATAAQGAASIVLAGCRSVNALLASRAIGASPWVAGGGAYVDQNISPNLDGSAGSLTDLLRFGPAGDTRYLDQSITSTVVAGQTWTFSVWLNGGGSGGTLNIAVLSSDGAEATEITINTGSTTRVSVTHTFAATSSAFVTARIIRRAANTATDTVSAFGAQLEMVSTATDFVPVATVKAGDILGLSDGQLVMAADDAAADDAGAMTVPLSNRLRAAVSSGTAVTWNKPTAEFMLVDAGGVPVRHDPGVSQPVSVEFMEVW